MDRTGYRQPMTTTDEVLTQLDAAARAFHFADPDHGYLHAIDARLQILDVMNWRAVTVGWLFLTVGVVVGVVWTAQARVISPNDPNLQAMSLDDPKILGAIVTWAVYSFAMFARTTLGWTGRRSAWLSALGFAIILLNFLPVNYFVTTSHTFQ